MSRVIDRFHIHKLACDAVQEIRIKHRWDAIQQTNDEMEEAKLSGGDYVPFRYINGDTRKELLIRSRCLLFKSADNRTESQKRRAAILFEEYPDIKKAYGLFHSLRMIFSRNTIKDAARQSMGRWYNKVEEAGLHSFNVIAAIFYCALPLRDLILDIQNENFCTSILNLGQYLLMFSLLVSAKIYPI